MKCKYLQTFAKKQNQAYRSAAKTQLPKEQIAGWSKQYTTMNVIFHWHKLIKFTMNGLR